VAKKEGKEFERAKGQRGLSDVRQNLGFTGQQNVEVDPHLWRYLCNSRAGEAGYVSSGLVINSAVNRLVAPLITSGDPTSLVVHARFAAEDRKDVYREWQIVQAPLHKEYMENKWITQPVLTRNTVNAFVCERMIRQAGLLVMTPGQDPLLFTKGPSPTVRV
jgi:hypothetical protein